jgi:hypothetical protein
MKPRTFTLVLLASLSLGAGVTAFGQSDGKIANMTVGGNSVRWDAQVSHAGGTLTIAAPDGRIFRKEFGAGGVPEISFNDKQSDLPDGVYNYELRFTPSMTAPQKDEFKKARGKDDESESERAGRKRTNAAALTQSGSFAIVNGVLIGPGAIEGERTGNSNQLPQLKAQPATPARISENTIMRLRNHRLSLGIMPDQVIADDLIVQGSECVGLDCVNNESFGFDTIRLKENNDRITFVDTSTGTGFPTEDWTIRANSNASGGGNFLAFVDRGATSPGDESGTIVFEVDAGAPANALRVSSTGLIGIRTATPALDVHVNSSNTPAFRMEQNNSGGFTAQTWDIGANEANWFVRDVTGGSRLPLRIRPGAPTSSIDISASGNVGIGTASPTAKVDVRDSGTGGVTLLVTDSNAAILTRLRGIGAAGSQRGALELFNAGTLKSAIYSDSNDSFINGGGRLGVNTNLPDQTLSVNGDASKVGGGSWQVFSDERLKNIKGKFNTGLSAVMRLQPIRYEYKRNNSLGLQSTGEHIGFAAQDVEKLVPEAVTRDTRGYLLVNNDPILWTMLNAIKEQQQEIAALKTQIRKLQAARPRRRR